MLSGQLAPSSSASFQSNQPHQQQQQHFYLEGDPKLKDSVYDIKRFDSSNSLPRTNTSTLYPKLPTATEVHTPYSYYDSKLGAESLPVSTTGYYSSSTSLAPSQSELLSVAKTTTVQVTPAVPSTGATPKAGTTFLSSTTSLQLPPNPAAGGIPTPPVTSVTAAAEASGRSAALERAYVHDVYENCEEPVGPVRPRVAQFLAGLDPGSIVCDVGCGNGRYLTACNPLVCTVGVDRCYRLTKIAREKQSEVALCDNLELPFRDESFDAVLSLAVVHHFATTERRVGAIRELARILRIGGRVVISVWALEQRHRRFESQDVLIPWQPPKNRNYNYSDDDGDDDDYLPPYHAYNEDSTNSSRSAGDGDSSSLSSSSPGESCYSFVRRAIQKLAGGRKHPWFLDSWNSKDTKNDSSLEYEDAKDFPIELRRLEDFEDFTEPPLSAGLKSRSLGSILNPPPRQIVRSRSSVPSLGAQLPEPKPPSSTLQQLMSSTSSAVYHSAPLCQQQQQHLQTTSYPATTSQSMHNSTTSLTNVFQLQDSSQSERSASLASVTSGSSHSGRRPKLVKQKQSLCDEDSQQLPDNPIHANTGNTSSNSNPGHSTEHARLYSSSNKFSKIDSKIFLRKQSSLNEELMAENRLREKERVRKRIQKQMSLNEAFLCRSVFTKRLQVIREGFASKLKTSTGNLERVTKNGLVRIMQNIKSSQFSSKDPSSNASVHSPHHPQCHHNHHHQSHHHQWAPNGSQSCRSNSIPSPAAGSACCNCINTQSSSNCASNSNCNNSSNNNGSEDQKARRHSRESGSDSSKDSSLQSDTSIESEDSFASVIFVPKPELNNQSQQQHQQHCSQSFSNSCSLDAASIKNNSISCKSSSNSHIIPSVPTSPLIMPCPPTPAHSPAATSSTSAVASSTTVTTHFSETSSVSPNKLTSFRSNAPAAAHEAASESKSNALQTTSTAPVATNCFIFDEDHIQQHQKQIQQSLPAVAVDAARGLGVGHHQNSKLTKITRQLIKDLPHIPKFRKTHSLQQQVNKVTFPIVRRLSAAPIVPKLMSLELFNPETDDLDSDSSEPSSPDSIDSVISALKPSTVEVGADAKEPITQPQLHKQELEKIQKEQLQQLLHPGQQDAVASSKINDQESRESVAPQDESCRQHLVDFAEKLSAQLLKELDESSSKATKAPTAEEGGGLFESSNESDSTSLLFGSKQSREDLNSTNPFVSNPLDTLDVSMKREELRERRLMMANLTRSASPTSPSTSSSASSLSLKSQSSKAKSSSSYSEPCEDLIPGRRFKFFRHFTNDRHHQYYTNNMADTTYLLPKDDENEDDNSYRSNDMEDCEIEHDVIIEEDENQEDEDAVHYAPVGQAKAGNSVKESKKGKNDENDSSPHSPNELPLDERPSNESWGHSTSTTSLDSPSQSGGSTTHHRYYHVFREGELDALINHHVASLHIVSSYYERASWCVVAEKVQVWTI